MRAAVAPGASWDAFNALLAAGQPGNGGAIAFNIDAPEITPAIPRAGVRRFGPGGERVAAFAPAVEARAVLEGQFLSMRVHGESIGITGAKRLIATGGASANKAVLQVLADVFGAPVFVSAQTDSASLGAAVRALQGAASAAKGAFVSMAELRGGRATDLTLAASPAAGAADVYARMLPAYKKAEAEVMAERK